ncbi:conserved hypothetical protein [Magnetococcus marinus MC-1]|uniref:DUF4935 domain-containing protein n=1 Tax=Magnetococcus marinus (strain ATCC BAA-1437 / JCM 17883 / MC-1) TaxID=156889 RepID=A0L6U2_MAGMM|nr:PIN domain-containing protein [Magnetococcus marinus]ABK43685.1 conserved hypothetical protein [Magnetococcus marinus MC-1]
MTDTASVSQCILSKNAPVLFFDTCSLLDLVRDPTRECFSSDQYETAIRLLRKVDGEEGYLHVVVNSQVHHELNDNFSSVCEDSENKLDKLNKKIAFLQRVYVSIGATVSQNLSFSKNDFSQYGKNIYDSFIGKSITYKEEDDVAKNKAFDRSRFCKAPAKKGKQELKDCIVIELYLFLAQHLRSIGYSNRIVFISSNTKDYASDVRGGILHPELKDDFDSVKMEYASNYGLAERMLFPPC